MLTTTPAHTPSPSPELAEGFDTQVEFVERDNGGSKCRLKVFGPFGNIVAGFGAVVPADKIETLSGILNRLLGDRDQEGYYKAQKLSLEVVGSLLSALHDGGGYFFREEITGLDDSRIIECRTVEEETERLSGILLARHRIESASCVVFAERNEDDFPSCTILDSLAEGEAVWLDLTMHDARDLAPLRVRQIVSRVFPQAAFCDTQEPPTPAQILDMYEIGLYTDVARPIVAMVTPQVLVTAHAQSSAIEIVKSKLSGQFSFVGVLSQLIDAVQASANDFLRDTEACILAYEETLRREGRLTEARDLDVDDQIARLTQLHPLQARLARDLAALDSGSSIGDPAGDFDVTRAASIAYADSSLMASLIPRLRDMQSRHQQSKDQTLAQNQMPKAGRDLLSNGAGYDFKLKDFAFAATTMCCILTAIEPPAWLSISVGLLGATALCWEGLRRFGFFSQKSP